MTLHDRLLRRAAIRDEGAKDEQELLDGITRDLAAEPTRDERIMLEASANVLRLDIDSAREGARLYREAAELIARGHG